MGLTHLHSVSVSHVMPATREFWVCASLHTLTLSGQDSGLDIEARPHALSINNNKVNMSDIAALEADIKEYKLQVRWNPALQTPDWLTSCSWRQYS